jgi:hypothetical protein
MTTPEAAEGTRVRIPKFIIKDVEVKSKITPNMEVTDSSKFREE